MFDLIVSDFKENKIENLDLLFRMFEPQSIKLYENETARVTFKTQHDAENCIDIMSLKPELIKRRVGDVVIKLDRGLFGGGTPKSEFNYKSCNKSGGCGSEVNMSLLKFPKKK